MDTFLTVLLLKRFTRDQTVHQTRLQAGQKLDATPDGYMLSLLPRDYGQIGSVNIAKNRGIQYIRSTAV